MKGKHYRNSAQTDLEERMEDFGSHWLLLPIFLTTVTGCDIGTDAATRLAHDIEAGAGPLGERTRCQTQHLGQHAVEIRGVYRTVHRAAR